MPALQPLEAMPLPQVGCIDLHLCTHIRAGAPRDRTVACLCTLSTPQMKQLLIRALHKPD